VPLAPLSVSRRPTRAGVAVRHEHPDHPVLPRGHKQLPIARLTDVQIHTRQARAHLQVDEILHRDAHPVPIRVAHVQLYLLDRRHRLRDAIVGLLQLGEIGGEQPPVLDVAKDELPA
jgi:hypothetical protein